jgi:WD40 repeat protein
VSGRKEVASLAGHTNWVRSVAFSPDGQHVLSGSHDNLVKVWPRFFLVRKKYQKSTHWDFLRFLKNIYVISQTKVLISLKNFVLY